jgi:hypothetical protein
VADFPESVFIVLFFFTSCFALKALDGYLIIKKDATGVEEYIFFDRQVERLQGSVRELSYSQYHTLHELCTLHRANYESLISDIVFDRALQQDKLLYSKTASYQLL